MEVISNFENAKSVMETSENSQLILESKKQHIKLVPKYIGNIRKGVHKQLAALLSHPDKMLDGFPVAYNNVRMIQSIGKMISDQTCIHFDILADFIMFKPKVGCKLNGKVNKVAKRHIGCLVHDHFNAWIPHTTGTEKIAADLLMGSEIEFTVQDISTNRNMLSIKGKFEKFLAQSLQKKITPVTMEPNKQGQTTLEDNTDESKEVGIPTTNLKKIKTHRKDALETSQDDETVESQNETQISETSFNADNDEHPSKPKEKHKKHKRKSKGLNESVIGETGYINDSIASLSACEPLFTSTQIDDLNNNNMGRRKEKKHKKKKTHKKVVESDNEVLLDSCVSNNTEETEEDTVAGIAKSCLEDSRSVQVILKSRKRRHEENAFIKLKDISVTDTDLSVASPVKKQRKSQKQAVATIGVDFDSSVDFEDNSKIVKKEKKKKKHREKLD